MTAAGHRSADSEDPRSWSAVSGPFDGTTIVIVNDAHSPARQESNLHHEAAHLIRGHRPSRFLKLDDLTLREYDQDAEHEAEWLAGCLHLPRAALMEALNGAKTTAPSDRGSWPAPRWSGSGDRSPGSTVRWRPATTDAETLSRVEQPDSVAFAGTAGSLRAG